MNSKANIHILNLQALLKPECVQYARICARKSPYLINIGRLHPTSQLKTLVTTLHNPAKMYEIERRWVVAFSEKFSSKK